MSVVLINPHISEETELGTSIYPVGLGYIASALQKNDIDVEIFDIFILKFSLDEVRNELLKRETSPDWFGITGMVNGYKYIKNLSFLLKEIFPDTPVVLGGSITNYKPEIILNNTAVDVCCVGDGEDAAVEITEAFRGKRDLSSVKGLVYRDSTGIKYTIPRDTEMDIDRFDFPSWDLFDMEAYFNQKGILKTQRVMHLAGSRGCPFGCKFCSTSNKKIRRRSLLSVIKEIELLKAKYGITHFEFIDEFYISSEKNLVDFSNEVIKRELGVTWWGLGRVNIINSWSEESISLLKKSGCNWMGIGVESGSQFILDRMNKGISIEEAKLAIAKLRRHGIYAACSFIIAYPGETMETIRETIDFCKEQRFASLRLNILTPLPGSAVYDEALQQKYITNEEEYWEKIDSPFHEKLILNMTELDDAVIMEMKRAGEAEVKAHYETIIKAGKG